jgi:hypothetical protein
MTFEGKVMNEISCLSHAARNHENLQSTQGTGKELKTPTNFRNIFSPIQTV